MVRQFLLPLLGLALLATEAATAQTLPAASAATPAQTAQAQAPRRAGRTLTARERRAAEKAAKVAAAKASSNTLAMATPAPAWSGWSDEPLPKVESSMKRPATNLSVAPGMPLNQVAHGVTTDYDGRPLNRTAAANTTLPR